MRRGETMDDGCVARIINAQEEQERLSGIEDDGSNRADQEGHPGIDDVRPAGDGNQPGNETYTTTPRSSPNMCWGARRSRLGKGAPTSKKYEAKEIQDAARGRGRKACTAAVVP